MRPGVSILQLDTHFPRIPGDVACPESYATEVEIIRIPQASVRQVVSARPDLIPMGPFEGAVQQAQGEVIVTSCGFLAPWQAHLSAFTDRPFVSSALVTLEGLCAVYAPHEVLVLTFDAHSLTSAHLNGLRPDIVGLHPDMHLRQVIAQDAPDLDAARAGREVVDLVQAACKPHHKALLLECTNLPPYRRALHAATGLPITDILTCIETARPGAVSPEVLSLAQNARAQT